MFQPCDAGDGGLAGAAFVGAALAATWPAHAASFSTGRRRGQKTPPTEPFHRRRSPSRRSLCGATFVGAALAATGPVHTASSGTGRCRGQKTPPTEPRHRRGSSSGRELCGATFVGAALAATWPAHAASFSTGCCRGRKTPPTEPRHRRRSPSGRALCGSKHCGSDLCVSGLGRDTACACRKLQHRPQSGSEDPSHRTPPPALIAERARTLWERSYILQLTAIQAARSGIG
jgi:hypothetical protein